LPGSRYSKALKDYLIIISYCLGGARACRIQGRQESSGRGGASLLCAGERGDALYLDQLVAACKLTFLCEAIVRKCVLGKSFEGGRPVVLVESLGEKVMMSASAFQS